MSQINMTRGLLLLCVVSLSLSCSAPITKEQYIDDFRSFVVGIENLGGDNEKKKWAANQTLYEKYVGEWYKKLSNDFTWREELEISQLKVRFHTLQAFYLAKQLTGQVQEDYTEAAEALRIYVENNMQDDLDFILKNVGSSGEAVHAEITALLDAINSATTQ
jgi:hypothetical protein